MSSSTARPAREPVAVAVIGCGAIANEHLPYLASSPRTHLAAVCDMSPATAAFAAERFGADGAFTDVTTMLATAKPAAVHVLTPPHTHASLVRQCLAAGCHIVCEKPMTGTAAETEQLLGEARNAGRWLIESRNYLFNDLVIRLKAATDDGTVGDVVEVDLLLSLDFLSGPFGDTNLQGEAVRLPAGAVHDFLPHLAYLFLHLGHVDGPVDEVRGWLVNQSGNPRAGFDQLDALVRAGAVRGRLKITADGHPDMFRVIVRGSKGTVESDLFNPYLRFDGAPNIGKRASLGQLALAGEMRRAAFRNLRDKVLQHGTYHGLPRMLDAFYAALQDGTPPPITAEDMVRTARFVDQLVALGNGR